MCRGVAIHSDLLSLLDNFFNHLFRLLLAVNQNAQIAAAAGSKGKLSEGHQMGLPPLPLRLEKMQSCAKRLVPQVA